jgi:hypothetical protein
LRLILSSRTHRTLFNDLFTKVRPDPVGLWMLHLKLIVHLLPLPKFSYLALLLGLMSPIVLQKGLKDELQPTLSIFETPAEPSSDVNIIVIIIKLLLIIIDYRE